MNKKCYKYYEKIDLIENDSNRNYSQWDLINLCAASWEKHGWNLIVISEEHATSHPFYEEYKEFILKLPTVNPSTYDYHCFMRWLAIANLGGGIMIDYDVVNLGVKDHSFFENPEPTVYQGHVPCIVSGTSDQYFNVAKSFTGLKDNNKCFLVYDGNMHTSDMIMLASGEVIFNKLNVVTDYPVRSDLVHVSCAASKGKTKLEAMKDLIESN